MNLKISKAFTEIQPKQVPNGTETELSLEQIDCLFHSKLKELCGPNEMQKEFIANNVWLVSEISFPVFSKESDYEKYDAPEDDSIIYSSLIDKNIAFEKVTTSDTLQLADSKNFSLPLEYLLEEPPRQRVHSKLHIHSLYACNSVGQYSIPLIVFPSKQLPNDCLPALYKSNCIQESQDGSLNDLKMFVEWLNLFLKQRGVLSHKNASKHLQATTVLIMNVYLLQEIIKNANIDEVSTLINICETNRVFILAYPHKKAETSLSYHLFEKFSASWLEILDLFIMKENVNTQQSFILIFKHVLRSMFLGNGNLDFIRASFSQILERYSLELNFDLVQLFQSYVESIKGTDQTMDILNDGEDDSFIKHNFRLSLPNIEKATQNTKLTEAETNSMVNWVDQMSRIGSMCIKYTFLREMYIKLRENCEKNSSKETLAGEKHWLDFVKSNKEKFSYEKCFALDENNYVEMWYDSDYWRFSYYKYIRETCSITDGDHLWVFDVISFPFSMFSNTLRPPEKDYDKRPRNIQPRISVLFAFNATGRYTMPLFVFPFNFDDQHGQESSSENRFCYSLRGFVTPKIVENWMRTNFLCEIDTKQPTVLMVCAKLAIIDASNLRLCEENNIKPFCMMNESQNAFIALFNKSLRKRQTDLFVESWRRTTASFNLSYQFKCDSKQRFIELFDSAFENCIQEMSSTSDSIENSSDEGFKNKIKESFHLCELWPIDEDKYHVYKDNYAKKLQVKDGKTECVHNTDQPNKESSSKTRRAPVIAALEENRKASKRLKV
jgi:hypothetical protein